MNSADLIRHLPRQGTGHRARGRCQGHGDFDDASVADLDVIDQPQIVDIDRYFGVVNGTNNVKNSILGFDKGRFLASAWGSGQSRRFGDAFFGRCSFDRAVQQGKLPNAVQHPGQTVGPVGGEVVLKACFLVQVKGGPQDIGGFLVLKNLEQKGHDAFDQQCIRIGGKFQSAIGQ